MKLLEPKQIGSWGLTILLSVPEACLVPKEVIRAWYFPDMEIDVTVEKAAKKHNALVQFLPCERHASIFQLCLHWYRWHQYLSTIKTGSFSDGSHEDFQ